MKLEYIDEYNDMSEPEKSLKRLIGILKYLESDYIDVKEVSGIMANSVMDGLGKVIGFEKTDHSTEKGGVE